MNEKRGSRGHNWGLLLLIPAAVLIAKKAKHRRAMWQSAWGAADGHDEFRLPPRIESMLDTWHTRAHRAAESTEPPIF
jgi:hypothetical protein